MTENLSEIGFGTWAWGNKLIWGYKPERDDILLEKTFAEAIKGGLTFIDTADSYGIGNLNGRSETLLGNFMHDLPATKRKQITIATKLAPFPWRLGKNSIKKAFNASKRRLRGNIDRVQLHWSTARYAPWQEAQLIDGLGDLYEEGCFKEIGLSNFGPKRLMWIHNRLEKRGIPIKSLQIQFSLLTLFSSNQQQLHDLCNDMKIELIAYSPLALGILAIPPGINTSPTTFFRNKLFQQLLPKTITLRKGLKIIGEKHNASQAQVALNWCRSHGTKPIPGIRNVSQTKDTIAALKWKLSYQEREYLDRLRKECLVSMPVNPLQSA